MTRIVGVHVPLQCRFSFIHDSIPESTVRVREFLHMRSIYRLRKLALIISGDIHGASRLIIMDFDRTDASKVLSIVRYYSHGYD